MPPVTVQADLCTILLPIPFCAPHNFIPLPPFPPTPFPPMPAAVGACMALEPWVNAWWPPGYATGGASFTTTVFHRFMQICLDGHDCGKFIPHLQVTPAPNNSLTMLHIPLSKRSANFAATTVKANGKGIAGMTLISWPPCPMSYCAEPVGLPLADATTSLLNNVIFGITLTDWIFGVISIAADIVIDLVFLRLAGGAGKELGSEAAKMIARSQAGKYAFQMLAPKLLGEGLKKDAKWAVKQGIGFAIGAARAEITGEGSASVSYEIGGPFLGIKVSAGYKRSADKGRELTYGAKGTALTAQGEVNEGGASVTNNHPLGLGSESASTEWGKPGSTTEQTTISKPFEGFSNTTTKTGPDGKTTVARSRPAPQPLANSL
jgi:hypothetical protein